ncbi:MAG: PLP-dependent transferase [Treponema sp.]|jgi:cystathionine beta-lyase/cystathionine gamma-synthase|nr:PLP-dependent transferase [Treponema sp.]
MRRGTLLIHNGHETDGVTGALGVPVVQISTFAQKDVSVSQEYDYSRSGNPTRKALEETIAILEGGARGYAFGSGIDGTASTFGTSIIMGIAYGGGKFIAGGSNGHIAYHEYP